MRQKARSKSILKRACFCAEQKSLKVSFIFSFFSHRALWGVPDGRSFGRLADWLVSRGQDNIFNFQLFHLANCRPSPKSKRNLSDFSRATTDYSLSLRLLWYCLLFHHRAYWSIFGSFWSVSWSRRDWINDRNQFSYWAKKRGMSNVEAKVRDMSWLARRQHSNLLLSISSSNHSTQHPTDLASDEMSSAIDDRWMNEWKDGWMDRLNEFEKTSSYNLPFITISDWLEHFVSLFYCCCLNRSIYLGLACWGPAFIQQLSMIVT